MTIEIFNCEQGSSEWHECRRGIPTASNFHKILAKGKGITRDTYMRTLAGEIITGACYEGYSNDDMKRGQVMEADARVAYELRSDNECKQVGFIRNTFGKVSAGASPDSLIDPKGGLEIKTKAPHLQIEVLEADELPSEHVAQVQGQLWVGELEWIDFASYWPLMPLFIKRVHRDEAYIRALELEVIRFDAELQARVARIRSM